MLCHRFEHCLRQFMRFEQMPEVQDRRLIRDRIASEFQIAERAHRLDIVERFLGARIRQIVPLLQAVDAQHHGDRKRSPSDNAARSLLPALTTAPPPPSRLETRRASCASSCPHSPASRSSAARPYCRPRIKGAVCHDPEVDQRFPWKRRSSGSIVPQPPPRAPKPKSSPKYAATSSKALPSKLTGRIPMSALSHKQ